MTSPAHAPTDRARAAARAHAMPYLVALLAGALPVFVFKDAFAIPVLAMIVYLTVGLQKADQDHQVFEFADSFYYLGFALSMASLLAALEPFSGADPDPRVILKRFGLGMFTTLIGVGGRTVLQMFYRLPQETLEAVNSRLLAQTSDFIAGLDELQVRMTSKLHDIAEAANDTEIAVLTRLADHQRGIAQAAAELNEQQASVKADILKFSRSVAALAERVESLRESVAGVGGSLNAVRIAGAEVSDLLGGGAGPGSHGNLVESLRATTDRFEALRASLGVEPAGAQAALDRMAEGVVASSSALLLQMSKAGSSFEALSARMAAAGVAPLEAAVQRLAAQLAEVTNALHIAAGRVEDGGLRPLQQALAEAAIEAKRFNTLLDDVADAVTLKIERLR